MTLDVLKLRGWLNACDSCEVEATCGKPVGEKVQLADGGRTCAAGYKTAISACRAERTKNICFMVVTREVSRSSDWSNADAPCKRRGSRLQMGQCAATHCGEAHLKHPFHGCDA